MAVSASRLRSEQLSGQLMFGWTAGYIGWWVNVSGSDQTNQMTVPLNSANGSVFFRLVRPY
jgi:hypothetical protein